MSELESIPIRPASTVVLLRDGSTVLEVLMVRRNRKLAFAGGFWVFPGGAVEEQDRVLASGDEDEAARHAAAREAEEEAGVNPDPKEIVLISHWTTPIGEPKRFSTWIFAGAIDADAEITIDGSEIHEHQWLGVFQALQLHRDGELPILPPTYITLRALSRYASAEEALLGERETPCPRILPLMVPIEGEGGFATLYECDVAYSHGDLSSPGPRHRALLEIGSWKYEYEGVSDAPPLFASA